MRKIIFIFIIFVAFIGISCSDENEQYREDIIFDEIPEYITINGELFSTALTDLREILPNTNIVFER